MPRKSPLTTPERAECRRMKRLRLSLRLTRTQFTAILGFVGALIENRESGASPWKPSEIARAKRRLAKHFAANLSAYRDTFGEDALPVYSSTDRDTASRSVSVAIPKSPVTLES